MLPSTFSAFRLCSSACQKYITRVNELGGWGGGREEWEEWTTAALQDDQEEDPRRVEV